MKKTSNTSLPAIGSVVQGTVVDSGQKGVLVSVNGVSGRIKLCHISTRFVSGEEVTQLYPKKSKVKDLVVAGVTPDNRLELKPQRRVGEPELGSIHKAIVKRVEKFGVIFGFPNSLARCLCVKEDLDDDSESCKMMLLKMQPGHKYTVKVTKVENGKLWVSMKQSDLGESSSKLNKYDQPVMEFVDPLTSQPDGSLDTEAAALLSCRPTLIDTTIPVATPSNEKRKTITPSMDPLENDDEDSTISPSETLNQAKKKSKRDKLAAKTEKEQAVREKESSLLEKDWKINPQTQDDFERLLVTVSTASASAWIKYMSYWLKMAEFQKAKDVAERALKVSSSFKSEQERFNLWIAYLNMEANFGSNADQLFLRAVQFCDAKAMHHAIAQVWIRANNPIKAKAMLDRTISKYHESRKAWMNLVDFLFHQNLFDEARTTFQKSLKALPAHKQVRATVKFAQLEFRNGNPERGATIFDSLISKKGATKTDIWSVYFDEQIKASTPPVKEVVEFEAVRSLFERATTMKLKPFKMKFVFKRWIDFEMKWGTEHSVDNVKQRAIAYVESVGNNE